jgi:hypothetical protein
MPLGLALSKNGLAHPKAEMTRVFALAGIR